MTLILDRRSKPAQWAFDAGLVAPRWQPLVRRMTFFAPLWEGGGKAIDWATRRPANYFKSTDRTWKGAPKGLSLFNNTAGKAQVWKPHVNYPFGAEQYFTIFIALEKTGSSGASGDFFLVHRVGFDWLDGHWQCASISADTTMGMQWNLAGFTKTVQWSVWPDNAYHTIMITRKASTFELCIDGVSQGTVTEANDFGTGQAELGIGANGSISAGVFGNYYCAFVAKGIALTAEDALELHRDPFAFMRPQYDMGQFFVPAAGGPFTVPLGLVSEADTAQPLSPAKLRGLGLAAEADTTFSVLPAKLRGLGQAIEVDVAQALTESKLRSLGQAVETDISFPLVVVHGGTVLLGQAIETDSAFGLLATKLRTLGLVSEADTAFALTPISGVVAAIGEAGQVFSVSAEPRTFTVTAEPRTFKVT